jgi:hypothetical protein
VGGGSTRFIQSCRQREGDVTLIGLFMEGVYR